MLKVRVFVFVLFAPASPIMHGQDHSSLSCSRAHHARLWCACLCPWLYAHCMVLAWCFSLLYTALSAVAVPSDPERAPAATRAATPPTTALLCVPGAAIGHSSAGSHVTLCHTDALTLGVVMIRHECCLSRVALARATHTLNNVCSMVLSMVLTPCAPNTQGFSQCPRDLHVAK